jgi:hypothetical protein
MEACASLRKKNIGKPYAGEPRVRFDEEGLRDCCGCFVLYSKLKKENTHNMKSYSNYSGKSIQNA